MGSVEGLLFGVMGLILFICIGAYNRVHLKNVWHKGVGKHLENLKKKMKKKSGVIVEGVDDDEMKEGPDEEESEDGNVEMTIVKDMLSPYKPDVPLVAVGLHVSAPFSQDGHYYDTEVLSVSMDRKVVRVRFLGYGNDEDVEMWRVRPLGAMLPHWSHQVDHATGAVYYFNHASGEASWERPLRPPLPRGWSEEVDEKSGAPYFFHSASGEASWEFPKAADEKALVPSGSDSAALGSNSPSTKSPSGKKVPTIEGSNVSRFYWGEATAATASTAVSQEWGDSSAGDYELALSAEGGGLASLNGETHSYEVVDLPLPSPSSPPELEQIGGRMVNAKNLLSTFAEGDDDDEDDNDDDDGSEETSVVVEVRTKETMAEQSPPLAVMDESSKEEDELVQAEIFARSKELASLNSRTYTRNMANSGLRTPSPHDHTDEAEEVRGPVVKAGLMAAFVGGSDVDDGGGDRDDESDIRSINTESQNQRSAAWELDSVSSETSNLRSSIKISHRGEAPRVVKFNAAALRDRLRKSNAAEALRVSHRRVDSSAQQLAGRLSSPSSSNSISLELSQQPPPPLSVRGAKKGSLGRPQQPPPPPPSSDDERRAPRTISTSELRDWLKSANGK